MSEIKELSFPLKCLQSGALAKEEHEEGGVGDWGLIGRWERDYRVIGGSYKRNSATWPFTAACYFSKVNSHSSLLLISFHLLTRTKTQFLLNDKR